jgi:hypothetical protein
MKNITFRTEKPDHRVPILMLDVEGVKSSRVKPSTMVRP